MSIVYRNLIKRSASTEYNDCMKIVKYITATFILLSVTGFWFFYNQDSIPTNSAIDNFPTPSVTVSQPQIFSPTFFPTPMKNPINSLQEIVWGNINQRRVIFTFDAGSGTQSLAKILEILKKYSLKGTFFLTGKWVEQNPILTRNIADEGHEIFNHTYSHPHLIQLTKKEISDELKTTENLILDVTGKSSKPYFRPPYGERNEKVLAIAAEEGYQSVYWTIDAWDWRESEGYTDIQIKERVLNNLKPGTIYLFHVGDNITGNILDEVIREIRNKGYSIVSLTDGI